MEITRKDKRKQYLKRTLGLVAVIIAINVAAGYFHTRLDLTAEKRYTLAPSTRALLQKLDAPVEIEVYLKGNTPRASGSYPTPRANSWKNSSNTAATISASPSSIPVPTSPTPCAPPSRIRSWPGASSPLTSRCRTTERTPTPRSSSSPAPSSGIKTANRPSTS